MGTAIKVLNHKNQCKISAMLVFDKTKRDWEETGTAVSKGGGQRVNDPHKSKIVYFNSP